MSKEGQSFVWGSATSSHQVEGNNILSDWYRAEESGKLRFKSGLACDHYTQYEKGY
jgi:beta-glucosidase